MGAIIIHTSVKSDVRSFSYRAKEEMSLCGWKLHVQNMACLRAVARVAIETTASTKSGDSNNGQICHIFIGFLHFYPIFLN
jgi:hypothetical protein